MSGSIKSDFRTSSNMPNFQTSRYGASHGLLLDSSIRRADKRRVSGIKGRQHVKTRTSFAAAAIIAAAAALPSAAQTPATPHVVEVIVLDVGSNMQKLAELSKRVDALTKQLRVTGTARYYMSTWAGAGAGQVIVTVEYPSLASLAQSVAKMNASPEFQKWEADVQASGIKVLSESLVTELHL